MGAADGGLRIGVDVVITGLKSAPELNGKEAKCESWDAAKSRWTVRITGGEMKALKPENLQPKEGSAAPASWVIGAIVVGFVATFLLQSGIFTETGVVSPVGYVKSLYEPFHAPPPKAPKDTVVISFCQGCGTNGLYNQISQLIEVRADKPLSVRPVNHPAPPMNVLLSQMVSVAQFGVMGATFMEHALVPPAMRENKLASCMGLFFVGSMFSNGLVKTNAFEIYLNERLLWSTLETHRKPSMQDLVDSFAKVGVRLQD